MTTPHNEPAVRVTAEPRPHPAIRKLARACIMLARQQVAATKADATTPGRSEGTQ